MIAKYWVQYFDVHTCLLTFCYGSFGWMHRPATDYGEPVDRSAGTKGPKGADWGAIKRSLMQMMTKEESERKQQQTCESAEEKIEQNVL